MKRNLIRFICLIICIICVTSLIMMIEYNEENSYKLIAPFVIMFISIGVYLAQEKLERYE